MDASAAVDLARELEKYRQENARLREELAERRRESDLLYEINKAINTLLVPEEIAALILQAVVTLTNADACSVMLLKDHVPRLRVIGHFGLADPEQEIPAFEEESRRSLAWEVCQSGRAFVLSSLDAYQDLKQDLFSYAACFPFIFNQEVIGTLNIHCLAPRYALGENQVEFLYNLAGQAALALKNALMYLEIKHQAALLEKQAITDGLTGLFNHLYFHQCLAEQLTLAAENGQPLAVLIGDLDFFKKLNDTYGHLFGDTVLREVAEIWSSALREEDIAARYGGEELAAILPGASLPEGKEIAASIAQRIAAHAFAAPNGGSPVHVTMSIGVAQWRPGETKSAFLDRADAALYQAKQRGRNRVEAVS